MKKNFFTLLFGGFGSLIFCQTARVQMIHNSADAVADTVDVYIGSTLWQDDFAFRTATPFVNITAGSEIVVSIAPKTSTSVNDTLAGLTTKYTFIAGSTCILIADGIISATGYTPNRPFSIKMYSIGRETANTSGKTDVLIHHGSTDAPTVDVQERTIGMLADNLSYGNFAGYLELATTDYTIDIEDASGTNTLASYQAPLASLNLSDSAMVVVASGFLDSTQNANGPSIGLFAALPSGGNLIKLPLATAVSIEEMNVNVEELNVYPNPTNDYLTIDNVDLSVASFRIIDLEGVEVSTGSYTIENGRIDVTSITEGAYQLEILDQDQVIGRANFIKL